MFSLVGCEQQRLGGFPDFFQGNGKITRSRLQRIVSRSIAVHFIPFKVVIVVVVMSTFQTSPSKAVVFFGFFIRKDVPNGVLVAGVQGAGTFTKYMMSHTYCAESGLQRQNLPESQDPGTPRWSCTPAASSRCPSLLCTTASSLPDPNRTGRNSKRCR